MNKLTWYNYNDTDADSFNIYWSVPGVVFPFSSLSTQSQMRFAATSPDLQEVTIDTTSIDTAVASINAKAKGIRAYKNAAGTDIIIRLLARTNARLKIYSCSWADDIGIEPQIIVPELNYILIDNVPFVTGEDPYEYDHDDGDTLDVYMIKSVTGVVESIPSITIRPMLPGIAYCLLEARFIDIQGRPVRGVMVTAEPSVLDTSSLSSNKVTVYSDSFGRVSLPLIQCQHYVLHIPAVGYNKHVEVPELPYINLTDYLGSTKPEFSPFGDVP